MEIRIRIIEKVPGLDNSSSDSYSIISISDNTAYSLNDAANPTIGFLRIF